MKFFKEICALLNFLWFCNIFDDFLEWSKNMKKIQKKRKYIQKFKNFRNLKIP